MIYRASRPHDAFGATPAAHSESLPPPSPGLYSQKMGEGYEGHDASALVLPALAGPGRCACHGCRILIRVPV